VTQPQPRRMLATGLAALVVASALMAAMVAPVAATDGSTFVSTVNVYRTAAGVAPVRLDAAVDKIATERANQMAAADEMQHDLDYVGRRLDQLGVCWSMFGEIIAWNSSGSIDTFVRQWDNSAPHQAIMLGSRYNTAGGSRARGDSAYYAAMIFVDPCGTAPAERSTSTTSAFTDVSGSMFASDIAWLVENDITRGCSSTRCCPRARVTREQMASFIERARATAATSRDYFWDDNASQHEGDINRVAAAGIASGCDTGRYCPTGAVSRGQMASFLVRALHLPAATRDWFRDDNGTMHEGAINSLAQAGVTGGCDTGRFCPNSYVTREQMSAFLHRAFGG
jgi:hypothetical protein